MAVRILRTSSRIVIYLPSVQAALKQIRAYAARDPPELNTPADNNPNNTQIAETEWPDPVLGPLSPNSRFILPGQVAPAFPGRQPLLSGNKKALIPESEIVIGTLLLDRHIHVMNQVQFNALWYQKQSPVDSLQCVVQNCSTSLRKALQDLFPNRDIISGNLTAITITQKTVLDMSGWSEDVDKEREQLLEQFIEGAKQLCQTLQDNGFWADFIDPSSGRPYHGDYTNSTLFETDERYRQFGLDIEDLGCCKVVVHPVWGKHAYVGSLFTDAPCDHPLLKKLIRPIK